MTSLEHRQPEQGRVTDASTSRSWRVHPARADPGLAFRGGATIVLLALATAVAAQSIVWGIGALGLLFIVTHRFFLPSEFAVDEDGVRARFPFRDISLPWKAIRFFEHGSRAANFSRSTRRRFADRLKELHVLLPNDRDERRAVVDVIKAHLPAEVVLATPENVEASAASAGRAVPAADSAGGAA